MSELSEYLESLPTERRAAIERVYARARALVPDAEDGVGYGMPAPRYRGKPLLSVMSAKGHIGLYPFSPPALDTVRDELAEFSLAKGTLRFTEDHPVPDDVLDRLLLARRDEIDGT
ncbi:iron chaperone [Cellulomonas rhizosphaerae]|uniref:DUF1801 domain-containing protein n=1 Tax=Cellulomonas rhizosphaerae TaxID=2293719 RepID=A0A413RN57_9CELL|nr:DUF1801 domain-containing protein [Cellulomonas rhizosphaerae]RHA43125.1 DUF1801 domain-containing protein [Cellulomonas rhizosphaerae]